MLAAIRTQLASALPPKLVDELLAAHGEAKRNWYLGGLRLTEVEGGRFCEAAFRLLEWITAGSFTALNTTLDAEALGKRLANLPRGSHPDAVRLHIPRALRLVYDIRNNRDAAHLADGIDPNVQDATLVTGTIDWVLAEFLRLYHGVSADEAQKLVDEIVTRAVPAVQDFSGFPKVLRTGLSASEYCLVLLYHRSPEGVTFQQLTDWVKPGMRANLRRTLGRLENLKAQIHSSGQGYFITRSGQAFVEASHLLE